MEYISIGLIKEPSTEILLNVSHYGHVFQLTGLPAKMWLNAKTGFCSVDTPQEKRAADWLLRMNLIKVSAGESTGRYRILTECNIVCTTEHSKLHLLRKDEAFLLQWIQQAGIHLTAAELVYLMERQIKPRSELVGTENSQALVEAIYTHETIFDQVLENLMEQSPHRERAVEALMGLLKKRCIVLI